jgi:hypothetical protein
MVVHGCGVSLQVFILVRLIEDGKFSAFMQDDSERCQVNQSAEGVEGDSPYAWTDCDSVEPVEISVDAKRLGHDA